MADTFWDIYPLSIELVEVVPPWDAFWYGPPLSMVLPAEVAPAETYEAVGVEKPFVGASVASAGGGFFGGKLQ